MPENILDSWPEFSDKVGELTNDKLNALISKLANHFTENEWTVDQAQNASRFAKTLPHEMLIHMWSELTKTRKIDNIRKIHRHLGDYIVEVVNTNKEIVK